MLCRTCGYSLFNLTEPRCPECGTGFDLRDFHYTPGTVGFACPSCGHLHGGTGEHHHPAATEQATCNGCGQAMNVASMRVVVLSTDPEKAFAHPILGLPWEQRKSMGRWKAWWATCKISMGRPGQLGKRIGPTTRWNDAYWYALFTNIWPSIIVAVIAFAVMAFAMSIGGATAGGAEFAMLLIFPIFVVAGLFLGPLAIILFGAGPTHLVLMLGSKPRGGFEQTACAYLYAQGPMIFMILAAFVPGGLGQLGLSAWVLIITILALQQVHGITGWRSTLAVLAFPLILLLTCCGLMALLFASIV